MPTIEHVSVLPEDIQNKIAACSPLDREAAKLLVLRLHGGKMAATSKLWWAFGWPSLGQFTYIRPCTNRHCPLEKGKTISLIQGLLPEQEWLDALDIAVNDIMGEMPGLDRA